jgi:hypothetical protein
MLIIGLIQAASRRMPPKSLDLAEAASLSERL